MPGVLRASTLTRMFALKPATAPCRAASAGVTRLDGTEVIVLCTSCLQPFGAHHIDSHHHGLTCKPILAGAIGDRPACRVTSTVTACYEACGRSARKQRDGVGNLQCVLTPPLTCSLPWRTAPAERLGST